MKSIGDLLKRTREKKRLTIEDVHKNVKIHPKYLRALEKDDYSVFSSKVHSKGFLKIYADFLNLNVGEVLALWRRDYEKSIEMQPKREFKVVRELYKPKLIITPGLIFISFIFISLVLFFSYLYYQYNTYTGVPNLEVYRPPEDLTMESDILDITGKTDLDSNVFINNEEIILGPDGSFALSVKLKEGLNTISIKAVNDLNKESEIVRTIIYRPVRRDIVLPSGSIPGDTGPGVLTEGSLPGLLIPDTLVSSPSREIGQENPLLDEDSGESP